MIYHSPLPFRTLAVRDTYIVWWMKDTSGYLYHFMKIPKL